VNTKPSPVEFLLMTFKGVGQIVFQDNAITGVLFLMGIALAGPLMALAGLLATLLGTATALLLGFDQSETRDGIYGFNSALIGIAVLFYLQPSVATWGLVVVGGIAGAIVCWLMRKVPWPSYTFPFIVTTWVLLAVAPALGAEAVKHGATAAAPMNTHHVLALLEQAASGVAEIMFGASVATGLCFLVGIAINNWRHAVVVLLGSLLGTLVAHYHNAPQSTITIGIYGYNAALAALALYLWRPSLIGATLAAYSSVPITEFFPHQLITLTMPFVAATWIVLFVGIVVDPHFTPPKPAEGEAT